MKPRPSISCAQALLPRPRGLLTEADGAARLVAGAQSLGPMLNLRLVQPRILIDITGIPELVRIEDSSDAVTLGACITTANIEDGRLPGRAWKRCRPWQRTSPTVPCATVAPSVAAFATRIRRQIGFPPSARWALNVLSSARTANTAAGGSIHNRRIRNRALTRRNAGGHPRSRAFRRADAADSIKCAERPVNLPWQLASCVNDPERGQFRAVIGTTQGTPDRHSTTRAICSAATRRIDEAAVLRVLDTARHRRSHHPPSTVRRPCARLRPGDDAVTTVQLTVNGRLVSESVEPRMHLADFLRERLNLTATHLRCEQGACGACTLLHRRSTRPLLHHLRGVVRRRHDHHARRTGRRCRHRRLAACLLGGAWTAVRLLHAGHADDGARYCHAASRCRSRRASGPSSAAISAVAPAMSGSFARSAACWMSGAAASLRVCCVRTARSVRSERDARRHRRDATAPLPASCRAERQA